MLGMSGSRARASSAMAGACVAGAVAATAACSLGRDSGTAPPPEPFPPQALRPEPTSGRAAEQEERKVARPEGRETSSTAERREERHALARMLAREGIRSERVLEAMRRVPRHAFVIPSMLDEAYADRALPIVGGQTISQPFVVAFMTEAAGPGPRDRCLEIGTGSGYQAAVLAELCGMTYSIEYLADVARFGAENLRAAGYGEDRVALRVGDGYEGWPEHAPFDVILVTAAPERVPAPLLAQLAMGGRLIVPVGGQFAGQVLQRLTRLGPGSDKSAFRKEELLDVRFVPFLGGGGER
jgi:protein-L-isoaspartate(D-aspartate) O-methyltransferase